MLFQTTVDWALVPCDYLNWFMLYATVFFYGVFIWNQKSTSRQGPQRSFTQGPKNLATPLRRRLIRKLRSEFRPLWCQYCYSQIVITFSNFAKNNPSNDKVDLWSILRNKACCRGNRCQDFYILHNVAYFSMYRNNFHNPHAYYV